MGLHHGAIRLQFKGPTYCPPPNSSSGGFGPLAYSHSDLTSDDEPYRHLEGLSA
jgi:hypothetical protein